MPKAAIYEHGNSRPRKNHIGAATKPRQGSSMFAKPQTALV
jgi:hypothetical protein